jgi:hypothetical protein
MRLDQRKRRKEEEQEERTQADLKGDQLGVSSGFTGQAAAVCNPAMHAHPRALHQPACMVQPKPTQV